MTIHDDVAKLRNEAAKQNSEADKLQKFATAFPDVQKYVGRWNKVAYFSKSANPRVTRFDLRHNCGCCNDSPLEIWPYLETEFGNVFSDPPKFVVGEKDSMSYGDRPFKGWRKEMEASGIPESILGAVAMHFRNAEESARDYLNTMYGEDVDATEPP